MLIHHIMQKLVEWRIKMKFLSYSLVFVVSASFLSCGAEAKLSSDSVRKKEPYISDVISACKFDGSVLNSLKAQSITTGVSSAVATAGSATSTALSANNVAKSSGEIDINDMKNLEKNRTISLVSSGIATGANVLSLGVSAGALSNINKLIDASEACKKALDNFVGS